MIRARRPRRPARASPRRRPCRACARPSAPRRARSASASATASAPSPASPTTSRSGCASRTMPEAHAQQLLVVDEQDRVIIPAPDRSSGTVRRRPAAVAARAGVDGRRRRPRRARASRRPRAVARGAAPPAPVSTTSTASAGGRSAARTSALRARARVLERVGQRLLHDPVDRELQRPGSAAPALPVRVSRDRQPARAHVLDQRVELLQPGLRARAACRWSSRSTPSSRRISSSACGPVRDTALIARSARPDRRRQLRRRRRARSSPTGCAPRCRASRARSAPVRRPRRAGPAGRARARAGARAR